MKNSQETLNKYLSYISPEYWDEAMDVLADVDEKHGKSVKNKKRKQVGLVSEAK
jgi:hypothetical protein